MEKALYELANLVLLVTLLSQFQEFLVVARLGVEQAAEQLPERPVDRCEQVFEFDWLEPSQ